jgi:hypothetical protein
LAVADTHEINPSDTAHHELDGSQSTSPSHDNAFDCQHCSHFHSPQLNLLPALASNLAFDPGRS